MEGAGTVKPDGINRSEWFEERKNRYLNLSDRYRKYSRLLSWGRVIAFVATFVVPPMAFPFFSTPFWLLILFIFTMFLVLVSVWLVVEKRHNYYKALSRFNHLEIEALDGNYFSFPEDGGEFSDPAHNYNFDIDIFGPGSIFQLVNRTSSPDGKKKLASLFNKQLLTSAEIEERQQTLGELSDMHDFREKYYAISQIVANDSPITDKLNGLVTSLNAPESRLAKILTIVFPILSITGLVAVLAGVVASSVLIYIFFGGLIFSGIFFKDVNNTHVKVSKLADILNSYSQLFKHISGQSFKSAELKEINALLSRSGRFNAATAVQRLASIVKSFDMRLNFLLAVLLNGFLMWDLRQSLRVKGWIKNYGSDVLAWFDAVHKIEAFNSLAGYIFANPSFCMPQLSGNITLSCKNVGHPMISSSKRICNNFELASQPKIVILTGANMAGKSTFLRTVGINYLLATIGCVVCADQFILKPLPLITNMRTSDSLIREESYFFAELKRLQFIVNQIDSNGSHLFILDEILKGTNSVDKAKGSKALTRKLLACGGTGIIATHDLELGELANTSGGEIDNHCFEVTQKDGGLIFDYKLRDGITSSHNATYLMKKMGLMDED